MIQMEWKLLPEGTEIRTDMSTYTLVSKACDNGYICTF